jgi:hypothetical protein
MQRVTRFQVGVVLFIALGGFTYGFAFAVFVCNLRDDFDKC